MGIPDAVITIESEQLGNTKSKRRITSTVNKSIFSVILDSYSCIFFASFQERRYFDFLNRNPAKPTRPIPKRTMVAGSGVGAAVTNP